MRIFTGRLTQSNEENQKAELEKYRDQLGIGKNTTFNTDAFENLLKVRRKDFEGFFRESKDEKAEKLSSKEATIKKILSENNSETAAVKNAMSDALSVPDTGTLMAAKNLYSESVKAFNTLLADDKHNHSAPALIGAMTQYKDDAVKAIKEQHANEKTALSSALNKDDVSANLKKALGLEGDNKADEKLKEAKDLILADLEKGHKKQLDYFNNKTAESLKQLHQSAQNSARELGFIANLAKDMNKKNETLLAIQAYSTRHHPDADKSAAVESKNGGKLYLKGISLEDIGTIQTITGKKIKREENGSYSMEFGRHVGSPLYYLDPRDNVTSDFTTMAHAIKASGHTSIKMSVNFDPKELAEKRAKQAFEGCIRAGFPLDKITLVVNGVPYSASAKNDKGVETNTIQKELFKNDPRTYNNLEQRAKNISEILKKNESIIKSNLEKPGAEAVNEIKNQIQTIRDGTQKKEDKSNNAQENEQRANDIGPN